MSDTPEHRPYPLLSLYVPPMEAYVADVTAALARAFRIAIEGTSISDDGQTHTFCEFHCADGTVRHIQTGRSMPLNELRALLNETCGFYRESRFALDPQREKIIPLHTPLRRET